MIKLMHGVERSRYPRLSDEMFRGRALIFHDRLGWDVTVENGWEVDAYDAENPLYLLSVDSLSARVHGSVRIMPTTGRTLLKEIFAGHFDEPVDLASATIWEVTRFCVHPDAPNEPTKAGINRTTCELFLGLCEVGLRAGLSQLIGVYDPRMIRIYRRMNWSPDMISSSDKFGRTPLFVGLWDVSAEALAAMRERSGIAESVLDDSESLNVNAVA
ncbi:MAG TPA: acyl-homoserine-lactone synthase [Beijerinckiaceae bacterium]|jgi:acyl homoserine lactone synthase